MIYSESLIVREIVKRLEKEGKETFTIKDIRRIKNEIFEGKKQDEQIHKNTD